MSSPNRPSSCSDNASFFSFMLLAFPLGLLEILVVIAVCLLIDPRSDWEWDLDRDLGVMACLGMMGKGKDTSVMILALKSRILPLAQPHRATTHATDNRGCIVNMHAVSFLILTAC